MNIDLHFGLYGVLDNGDELLLASSDRPLELIKLLITKNLCEESTDFTDVCSGLEDGFLDAVDVTGKHRIRAIQL